MSILSAEQVREILRQKCERAGSQGAWAAAHGLSQPHVSHTISGARAIGRKVATVLDLEKVTMWREKKIDGNAK